MKRKGLKKKKHKGIPFFEFLGAPDFGILHAEKSVLIINGLSLLFGPVVC